MTFIDRAISLIRSAVQPQKGDLPHFDIDAPMPPVKPPVEEPRTDGWYSTVTGRGVSGSDRIMSYLPSSVTILSDDTLENLFDGDWLARKIVSLLPETAFRKGVELATDDEKDDEEEKRIWDVIERLDVVGSIREAIISGRLYGGSLLLLGVNPNVDIMEPLDLDSVNELTHLTLFDKRDLVVSETYDDVADASYGDHAIYRVISADGKTVEAHASHFIRFDGAWCSRRRRARNGHWYLSVLQAVYDEIRGFNSDRSAVHDMISDSSQAVLKIPGFFSMVTSRQREQFNSRISMINQGRHNGRIMPIDGEEDFAYVERAFSQLYQLLEHGELSVAAAANMPVTVLFGRSPAGESATGESDLELWYGQVESEREDKYLNPLNELVKLCARTAMVRDPDSWYGTFPEIRTEDAKKRDDRRKVIADTDVAYINADVYTPEEVAEYRFGGGEYDDTPLKIDMSDRELPEVDVTEDPFASVPSALFTEENDATQA
jgi:phage-related protein (TIGR01555 family)